MSRFFDNTFLATCVLFLVLVVAHAIDTKPCEEGKQWKDKCHTCQCSNGKVVCTRELCEGEGNSAIQPTPLAGANTPKSGCTPGEKWMEDCNNCICDNEGEPECSRRICGRPSKKNPMK